MSSADPTAPADLNEVRIRIDVLDGEIVHLLARRATLVQHAARFKKSDAEVAAPARVEQVVAKVRALAAQAGLAPEVAEATYRALIGAFIELERAAVQARGAP